MKIAVTTAVSLALHLTLGWAWTLLAGVAGGVWAGRRGGVVGGAGVGLGWLLLVIYNFAVAAPAVRAMTATMGGILGNLPAWAVVALTLLVGVMLGATGGVLGARLARVRPRKEPILS